MVQSKEQRVFHRIPCGLELTLRRQGHKVGQAEGKNVSMLGVGLTDLQMVLAPGEVLEIDLEGLGPVTAEVRWCRDGSAGLKFRGILTEVFDSWVGEFFSAHRLQLAQLVG